MLVCARRLGCGAPDTGALDQYMPEAGAGDTFGAVLGSGRGGKSVCCPRTRELDDTCRDEVGGARFERVVIAEPALETAGLRPSLSPSLETSPPAPFKIEGGGLAGFADAAGRCETGACAWDADWER